MHILFLSHYFPPEVNAPASRTYDHTRRWVKESDVDITIITNPPNHPNGVLFPGYSNTWRLNERIEGIDVVRVKTYLTPNAGFFRRIGNYMFYMMMAVLASFKVRKPDIVIATSPQFFCAVAGYVVSRIKRIPFVFELRDIWPESILALEASKPNISIRILEKIELFLYRKAKCIISLTDAFKENLVSRGIDPRKILVVKNGVDLDFFNTKDGQPNKNGLLGYSEDMVLSYIGTIGMAHKLEKIVSVAEHLKNIPHIRMYIIGEGAEKKYIKDLISQKKLKNIKVLDGVSKEKVKDYYRASDVILVVLRKAPLFKTVIPSKIFEAMAMKRPIFNMVDGECREIIEEADCGFFVEPEDVEGAVAKIKEIYLKRDEFPKIGKNGREYVEKYYDRNLIADRYLKIIRDLAL
ncbi:MAG: glycosyltransferase family 4 protein [bacterium]